MSTKNEINILSTDGWVKAIEANNQGSVLQNIDATKTIRYAETAQSPATGINGMLLKDNDMIRVMTNNPAWVKTATGTDIATISVTTLLDPVLISQAEPPAPPIDPDKIQIDGELNLVVIGASIMERSFTDEKIAEALFAVNDIKASVHMRAVGGSTTAGVLSSLNTHLTEFAGQEDRTIFMLHAGGNNITNDGPYPGGAATIESEWRQIVENIQAANFEVIGSSITYRVPPASNPSEPYNTNIINPLIQELMPAFWDSVNSLPKLDLYRLTFEGASSLFVGDGVHPNYIGKDRIRGEVVSVVSANIQQTGVTAQELADWKAVTLTQLPSDVVVSIGYESTANTIYKSPAVDQLYNQDGTVNIGMGVSISGYSQITNQTVSASDNTADPLSSNLLRTSYANVNSGGTITIDFEQGLNPTDTYTVGVQSIRVSGSTFTSAITVGGVTNNVVSTSSPSNIVYFNGVTGQQLLDNGITVTPASGSSNAYINGFRVISE